MELSAQKKILLITSGQPSLNPRLVKEADALTNAGYDVTVLYAYWNDWGTAYDIDLLANRKWKAIRVGGHPQQNKRVYNLSRIIHKVAKGLFLKTSLAADLAVARASYFLIREAKKHKAHLYIAHNLGALPAAVKAAKYHSSSCGFDAEDFHRYEVSNDDKNEDVILKSTIENKYIPQLNYLTASSPQIAGAYKQLFANSEPIVLLNVFPKSEVVNAVQNVKEPLKLLWFSQTIGPNRGLEDIIKALQQLNKADFELHLLGSRLPANKDYVDAISNSGIGVTFHHPVPQDELISFTAKFDIGLALEPGFSINNDRALSNKLFTYMQAGLAAIASDTTAQKDFMDKNPGIGKLYPKGNFEDLANILSNYNTNRDQLLKNSTEALKLAQEQYNWEAESQKLVILVKNTIAAN